MQPDTSPEALADTISKWANRYQRKSRVWDVRQFVSEWFEMTTGYETMSQIERIKLENMVTKVIREKWTAKANQTKRRKRKSVALDLQIELPF